MEQGGCSLAEEHALPVWVGPGIVGLVSRETREVVHRRAGSRRLRWEEASLGSPVRVKPTHANRLAQSWD